MIKKKLLIILSIIIGLFLLLKITLYLIPYKDLNEFLDAPYSLKIYDRNNTLIYTLPLDNGIRREYSDIDDIPKFVRNVFIRSEDKRFYFHFGFDFIAFFRTFFQNIKEDKIITGASTISMQLSRIITPHKKGYSGKITEIINAIRIESKLSKKEILELWLNSIPFGSQAVGIESASKEYFGKTLKELSPKQVLALAIIPRSPEKYNPDKNADNLLNAVNHLSKLLKIKTDYDLADISEKNKLLDSKINKAPHFINYIKNRLTINDRKKNGVLISSLDLNYNNTVERLLRTYLDLYKENRITNGAVYAINNRTGEIVVYIGSKNFDNKEFSGEIDGVQVTNQPGSTIKAFLYALALDNGFLPNIIMPDIPMDFGRNEVYVPMNFNRRFNGPVRLRIALASSLNVPAVYLVTRLGVNNFIDKLLESGFDSLNDQQNNLGSGIALGNCEVSLYELVNGFSTFPRSGMKINPAFYKHHNDTVVKGERIFSQYSADMICDILSDAKSRYVGFGNNSTINTKFPVMLKTGTSNQFNNIWALAATPYYSVGVWMGNFSGETVIGKTGSSLPTALAIETLKILNPKEEIIEFNLSSSFKKEIICSLSGKKVKTICPGALIEYFPEDYNLEECDYHFDNNGLETRYPVEYQEWLKSHKKEGATLFSDDNEIYPKITKPNNESVFYLDSSLSTDMQAIRIEVVNLKVKEDLDMYINGEYIQSLCYPYQYLFNMKAGNWEIMVKSSENNDKISFVIK